MSTNMSNARRRRKARGGPRNGQGKEMISHPPEIQHYEIRHGARLRFTSTSAVSQNITFQNLLDTFLVAATATTAFDAFYAVKVRSVEVWTMPAIGTSATATVLFAGGTAGSVGDQATHTDTSMGVQPAHVRAVPSKKSLASNYQLSTAAVAFTLVCPTGSVIDLELSFLDSFVMSVAAQNAVVGAAAGSTYLRGFDGLAIATTKVPPAILAFSI